MKNLPENHGSSHQTNEQREHEIAFGKEHWAYLAPEARAHLKTLLHEQGQSNAKGSDTLPL